MSAATMERVRERIATTAPEDARLRVTLVLAHELLRQRMLLDAAPTAPQPYEPAAAAHGNEAVEDYGELVRRIHAVALAKVPREARVLVVSRGDEALLSPELAASHFPQGPGGAYAGHYPADSDAAIAHLEQCRAKGAEFLLLPATGFWWLDYYGGLLQHLMGRGRVLHHDGHCVIFDLRAHAPGGQS
ncbi:MAG TPA: hypothetical protein VKB03_04200 [Conexibacter sp.]|nr:hypothetical protein [Conexibacter sp.]